MALPARDTRSLMPTPTPATTRYACWWTASTMFPRRRAFTLRSPAPSVRCSRRPPRADFLSKNRSDYATASQPRDDRGGIGISGLRMPRYFAWALMASFHWYYDYRKRSSPIVCHDRNRGTELIATEHRVLVVRGEDHHVRMPMADSGCEMLIRRPHV